MVEIDAERFVGVQRARGGDQGMGECRENTPIPILVGIGQGTPGYGAAKPHVIEFASYRTEACFDVAQAFPIGQLREDHCQILIPIRELPRPRPMMVLGYAFVKFFLREIRHQFGENETSCVHPPSSGVTFGRKVGPICRATIQIVPSHNSCYRIEDKSLIDSRKVLYRTLVI